MKLEGKGCEVTLAQLVCHRSYKSTEGRFALHVWRCQEAFGVVFCLL